MVFRQVTNRRYYDDAVKLLELASRATALYTQQPGDQKNRVLRLLLSNCTLQNATLQQPTAPLQKTVRDSS